MFSSSKACREDEEGELFEAFCETHIEPLRQGRRLRFRCTLSGKVFDSQQEVHAVTFRALLSMIFN